MVVVVIVYGGGSGGGSGIGGGRGGSAQQAAWQLPHFTATEAVAAVESAGTQAHLPLARPCPSTQQYERGDE